MERFVARYQKRGGGAMLVAHKCHGGAWGTRVRVVTGGWWSEAGGVRLAREEKGHMGGESGGIAVDLTS